MVGTDVAAVSDEEPLSAYEVLRVASDDPSSVIRKAYFRFAKEHHPDKVGQQFIKC